MTKHGQRKQLKRIATPRLYPIPKKEGGKFAIKPAPGPHPADRCIPLGVILRDLLGYARTLREVKKILNQRVVKIDGRVITDYKFPVGLMDVIEITETEEYFRVLPFRRKFVLHEITKEEARYKLVKIINKRYVKGANIQINLFDGRNILFKVSSDEERREILDKYKVGDTLMITVPEQKIVAHYKLAVNNYALISAGRHMGEHGVLRSIHKRFGPMASIAEIEKFDGEKVLTALEYVFIIGDEKPAITLPTEEEVKNFAKRKPLRI